VRFRPQFAHVVSTAALLLLACSAGDVLPPSAPPTAVPAGCDIAEPDVLQDVTETPAAPYFVHHPTFDGPAAGTVVFIAGGSTTRGGAQRTWQNVLAAPEHSGDFRVVLPYSVDSDFHDDPSRAFAILDEVLRCYGGDPARVHIAGSSNGGLAAFALMLAQPNRFATLLGAPGAFDVDDPSTVDPQVWVDALSGRAVFNGVGELDVFWQPEVEAINKALTAAGIESQYVEFPGRGHSLRNGFDASIFFDFWLSH